MNHIEGTTPQLKFVDRVFEAYRTRDHNNIGPLLSKNYTYRSFPKIADLPDQTKEKQLAVFGPKFARLEKLDVHFQHRETILALEFKSTTLSTSSTK